MKKRLAKIAVSEAMSPKDRMAYSALLALASLTVLLAYLWQHHVLHEFDQSAALLPRGTEIRPMGLTGMLAATSLGTIAVCLFLSVPTIVLALRGSKWLRWLRIALALAVLAGSFILLPHGRSRFQQIVQQRGLVLEE